MQIFSARACTLFVFFMAGPAHAADYYVSSAGYDSGPGTLDQPWKTITRVNDVTFVPGDRVFFAGGETFIGSIYLDATDAGTAADPIVIGSYGTGRATISASSNSGFYAFNTAGINIKDLIFTGPGAAPGNVGGIIFYTNLPDNVKLDGIDISNVDVSGFNNGVAIGSWNGSTGYSNVRVTNSLLHDNSKAGLTTYGLANNAHQNVYIGDVDAYNQTGVPGQQDPTGNGIVLGGVDGGIIEHCAAWNNGAQNTNSAGPVGIWAYNSNNIIIQYNEAYLNRTNMAQGGGDGGGFDLDGGVTNSVIQYNYAHDNDGPGYLLAQYNGAGPFSNNVIRYNVSQNDGRKAGYDGGITVWGYSNTYKVDNSQIHDNTVVMDPAPGGGTLKGIYLVGSYSGITVRNNTFITSGGVRLVQADGNPTTANALFQCNDYWPTGDDADPGTSTLIQWGSAVYTSVSAFMAGQSGQELCPEETEPPAFVGTACPAIGNQVDYAALDAELEEYQNKDELQFGIKLLPATANQCKPSYFVELPVPCGKHVDYQLWKMGGSTSENDIGFGTPYFAWNAHYRADGMWENYDLFDNDLMPVSLLSTPQETSSLVPCNDARMDPTSGPTWPIDPASEHPDMIRAFSVHTRAEPDLSLPENYQMCYDRVELIAGSTLTPCSASTTSGALYIVAQPKLVVGSH